MITLNMDMPESCAVCPMNIRDAFGCLIMPHVPAWIAEVEESTDKRAEHCPLDEKMLKDVK